jgi:hypothetical protein
MVGSERREVIEIGVRQQARVRVAVAPRARRAAQPFVLALLLLGMALFFASHIAKGDEVATIAPDSGSMSTSFTFSVSGMTPGHGVEITVIDGTGNRFTYQQNGTPQALVVGPDGSTAVALVPGRDLPGSQPGGWTVTFTEEESGNVATIPFSVSGF